MKRRLLKTLTSLVLVALMVVSMMPAIAITTSAADSVTLGFAGGSGTNIDPLKFTDDASGVSAVFTAGTHSTKPRWDAACVRFYGTASVTNHLTISAPAGSTITSIEFEMNGSYNLAKVSVDSGEISGTTWTGDAEKVVFTTTEQTRINGVTITYSSATVGGHTHNYAWNGNVGADGSHTLECSNKDGLCTVTTKTVDCEWDDGVVTTGPTCTSVGEKTFTCTVCGATKKEPVEMTDHNYVNGSCADCSEAEPATLTITKSNFTGNAYAWNPWTATTTTGETISGYGYTYGANANIQLNGSKDGDYIYNTTALPGKIVSITLTKASGTDRNFDILTSNTPFDSATAASLKGQATAAKKTVTTTGVTWEFNTNHRYFAIIICDSSAAYLSSIEITYSCCAHSNTEVIGEDKDATCTEAGSTSGLQCSDCGEIITATTTINPLGHKDENPADSKCDTCGTNLCTEHKWVEGDVITEGDCLTDRVVAQHCENCNEPGENKVTEAPGHSSVEIPGTDATCTTDGLTAGAKCEVCDEILTEQETIPAGHKWDGTTCTGCSATRNVYTKVDDVTTLVDGDGIVIYYPAGNKLLSGNTASSNKLAGVNAAVTGTVVGADNADELFLIVRIDDNGDYYFETADGKYLTSGATGNALTLENELTDYAKWYFDTTGTTATLRIVNRNAAYNGNTQALEYYYNFTVFGLGDTAAFNLELYKLDGYSNPSTPAEPTFNGFSLSLNKGITVKVTITVPAEWLAANPGAKVVFSNGTTIDAKAGENVYTTDLTPAFINDNLTVKLQLADSTAAVDEKTVSVSAYKEKVASLTYTEMGISEAKYNALISLLNSALTYSSTVDSTYTSSALTSSFENVPALDVSGDSNSIIAGFQGKLGTYASLALKVNSANIPAEATIKVTLNGKILADGAFKDYIVGGNILINNLYPANFNDEIVISANGSEIAKFNFNSYLKAIYDNGDVTVKNVAVATYNYGIAAEEYISAQ